MVTGSWEDSFLSQEDWGNSCDGQYEHTEARDLRESPEHPNSSMKLLKKGEGVISKMIKMSH